jgi:hypothetical protein
MGTHAAAFPADKNPIERVSYEDIRGKAEGAGWPAHNRVDPSAFLGRLRARSGLTTFDLPTDAQWEYACRAGTTTARVFGDDPGALHAYGNYKDKRAGDSSQPDDGFGKTAPVGSYRENAWGLYDVYGNVWEWCLDWSATDLGNKAVTDPKGAASGSARATRGAAYHSPFKDCRSARRAGMPPDSRYSFTGFRLCFSPFGDVREGAAKQRVQEKLYAAKVPASPSVASVLIPKNSKKYYIDCPAIGARLSANGPSAQADGEVYAMPKAVDRSATGSDVEWRFVAVGDKWHIQAAAGGSTPRLWVVMLARLGGVAMTGTEKAGGWTQFMITDAGDGTCHITAPEGPPGFQRLGFSGDGKIECGDPSSTSLNFQLVITEIERVESRK